MNLSNSSAEPNYLAHLGLSSTPFSLVDTTSFFFRGEQIEQRLNLLLHLARSSNKVGILIADKGLGKSTLIAQMQHDSEDDLRIVRVAADPSLNRKTLITYCFHAFGVEELTPNSGDEHALKERFKRLRQLNIRPVLLIDDIDQLSESNIEIVMSWLSWKDDDDFLLQAIFTASKSVAKLDTIYGRLQRVDLPSLTEQELDLYLSQRLEASGYKGDSLFDEKEIKGIYRQSSGNLTAVNQLAHQHLSGATSLHIRTVPVEKKKLALRKVFLGCLVVALLALLIFQDDINALLSVEKSQENVVSENIEALPDEEPVATVIIDESDEIVTSVEQADRDELTTLLAELPLSITSEGRKEENITPEPEPVMERALEYQTEWVRLQNKTNYTFQLMGSWEHEELFEFVDKYQLTGDVAEFESDRQGRVWYALVYGVYESKKEALKASSEWPEPLNTLPSWLRSFDQIHYQIKNKIQE